MIAYNRQWLDNTGIQQQVQNAFDNNSITKPERDAAILQFPSGFYTPNIFIRVGLFILTAIIAAFSLGLMGLIFLGNSSESFFGGLLIFFGLICYVMLELIVKNKNHYCSGVDDALLMLGAINVISGINVIANTNIPPGINALLILIFALYGVMRFTDRLMMLITILAFLMFIFFMLEPLGNIAKDIMPFVLMMMSAAIYFISKQFSTQQQNRFYRYCFVVAEVTALVCFYAAGNYFVVREASSVFFNVQLKPAATIPFGWLFWLFTVSIPLLYIIWGIIKKNIILIRAGILLIAITVFTVRFYYAVLPAEAAMILAGIILVAVPYLLAQLLKQPKGGFTVVQTSSSNQPAIQNIEAIVIAETVSPGQQKDQNRFGGGSFGGGGASGEY